MNIGVIGAGKIGGTAARLFVTAGHQVTISNSRGPASLAALREALGPKARAGTVAEAAAFGDLVLVAIPFGQFRALPATPLAGKVVVDAMNYYPQRDGRIEFGDLTSSELVAQSLSGARLVKAFNTMYFETLAAKGRTDEPMGTGSRCSSPATTPQRRPRSRAWSRRSGSRRSTRVRSATVAVCSSRARRSSTDR